MRKSIKFSLASLLLLPPIAFANKNQCKSCNLAGGDFYIGVQGGVSNSDETNLEVNTGPDPLSDWDPAPEGYNGELGDSEVLGANLGYAISPLTVIEIEVANRSAFEYVKQQTGGDPKTRHFDFINTTVMANLILNGSGLEEPFNYVAEDYTLDPFVKVGAGVAYNTVENFHSVHPDGTIIAMMADNTETTFAYQVGAGINIRTTTPFVIGVGYRYLDGGDFSSNDYLLKDTNSGATAISPWEGDFTTNEVYISLSYVFDE